MPRKKKIEPSEKPKQKRADRSPEGRFLPGISGNPSGRAASPYTVTAVLKRILAEDSPAIDPATGLPKQWSRLVAERLIMEAVKGDVRAAEIIMLRTEGRPPIMVVESGAEDMSAVAARAAQKISDAIRRYSQRPVIDIAPAGDESSTR
jgi:hypothetical protein